MKDILNHVIDIFLFIYFISLVFVIWEFVFRRKINILSPPYGFFSFVRVIVIFTFAISSISIFITPIYFWQDNLFNFLLLIAVLFGGYLGYKMNSDKEIFVKYITAFFGATIVFVFVSYFSMIFILNTIGS